MFVCFSLHAPVAGFSMGQLTVMTIVNQKGESLRRCFIYLRLLKISQAHCTVV